MNKGIYSRGYLPHWDFAAAVQAITFRLADSVPSAVIRTWGAEVVSISDESERRKQLHRRIARYEDAGHGDSILLAPECAAIVQEKLQEGHPSRYRLIDWCIMPNHVHVLLRLSGSHLLSKILGSWKGGSAFEINRLLRRTGPLWQREYHDRYIRDLEHFHDCRAYIRNNPVKAGLCGKPEDWKFSSAGCDWNPDGAPASAGLEEGGHAEVDEDARVDEDEDAG